MDFAWTEAPYNMML